MPAANISPQQQTKSNKSFMLLSFFGILFVLDAHLGSSIGFFSDIFPYDSFFMPMFVFISGYFYKTACSHSSASVLRYILRKTRTLLLPYLLWAAFYGIVTHILRSIGLIKFGGHGLSVILYEMCTSGWSYGFNDPAWFVPMLFCVSVLYCFLRRIFGNRWNDWAAAVLLIALGCLSVSLSKTGFRTPSHYMLLKLGFFLQFFHIGKVFCDRMEAWFNRLSTLRVCLLTAACNMVLLTIYGADIAFPSCAAMENFHTNNPLLPLLTSLTGIAFWLKISKALVPVMGNHPLVNFISSNTFFIMIHHLACKWIFNGLLLVGKKIGIPSFSGADSGLFVSDPWYIFGQNTWISAACFLFMLAGCTVCCCLLQKIKKQITGS